MTPTLKLPLSFDIRPVRAEVETFTNDDWTPHFNTQYYEGDWSGIALRSGEDAHVALYPDPTAAKFVDTDAMTRCPSVKQILKTFECETESVRFLRLGVGDKILEHRDYKLSIEDGVARIHIPVKTSSEVEFYLDGKRIEMNEGEAWYLNFNLPHRVENKGSNERIHLVIDCIANDWLRSFFV